MQISDDGLDLIKSFETCRLETYYDQAGVPTIAWGHTYGVQHNEVCTQTQADNWLKSDVKTAEIAIQRLVSAPLLQNQYDALCSFIFNLGINAFRNSTLLILLNKRQYDRAALEFDKWVYCAGKIDAGLVRRRAAEAAMFSSVQ